MDTPTVSAGSMVRGKSKNRAHPGTLVKVVSYLPVLDSLVWLWKAFKMCIRLMTGTTEMLRLCDRVLTNPDTPRTALEIMPGTGDQDSSSLVKPTSSRVNPDLATRVDQCLHFSTKLMVERKWIETGNDESMEAAFAAILRVKLFPMGGSVKTPHAVLLHQCLVKISSSWALIHKLGARAKTPYDSNDPAHEKLLLELWDLASPREALTGRTSSQWQTIGFQGNDPATDFRGLGLLGLDCLVHHARHHPESLKEGLQISRHPTKWFSHAVVGINVAAYALELARTRRLQYTFHTLGATRTVFKEVYVYIADGFAQHWEREPDSTTVMDFGDVFKRYCEGFEDDLALGKGVPVLNPASPLFKKKRKDR
ncbi:hypothetical protein HKX48_003644 [Thoreauomyces humboldtii]|nr:hypothetical protein HKX48_003644 [Thoreauomyces humboldtii]